MNKIDPKVARAARAGAVPGVIILAEREERRGPIPLALEHNLRTAADRAHDLRDQLRDIVLLPECRQERGTVQPLAVGAPPQTGAVVLPNLGALMGSVDERRLLQLQDSPRVRKVLPIPRLLPTVAPLEYRVAAPADMVAGPVWGLRSTRVAAFWDAGLQGQRMRVGHFDTGFNASHEAFAALLARQGLRYTAFGADGAQLADALPIDRALGQIVYHGTHTAGTMVGNLIGTTQIGVAPQADLISVQIFPDNPAPTDKQHDQLVINGLNWIVGERPSVINLSFGSARYDDSYLDVIGELVEQNIVVVASVGNTAGQTCSPGNYGKVVCVGAVDEHDRICDFSGSGRVRRSSRPDLCAPGRSVISAGQGNDAALSDGTSMAAPHVAGIVALARQKNPDLTPLQIKNRLKRTSRVPDGWDTNRGGAGILDAQNLLSAL